ncbi:Saccharopine dehydrogenase-domain-containing protein [Hysterangium stoloniferum]|nr:Saccharopine dehydrogenase-domain-containing protein [Hysterangium stoloniferum]
MPHGTDILVLGATGFTGQLVTKYLNEHRDRTSFTFALAARSKSKLSALAESLQLNAQIPMLVVDVTKEDQVDDAVKTARIIINTVGPYCTWGTPVVRACARNGVHYVDLTGETAWIKDIIEQFDLLASKNGAVIIPSCGYDSIPSDLSAYLSIKTLKARLGPDTEAGESVTSHRLKGGISFGTLSTIYTYITEVPRPKIIAASRDHSISPASGAKSPRHKLVYSMPHITPRITGGFFLMSGANRSIVLRTRGLIDVTPSMKDLHYGPKFTYEEFLATSNQLTGMLLSVFMFSFGLFLSSSKIAQWLFKHFVVDTHSNPTYETMQKNFLKLTNVTSSVATSAKPEMTAKTIIKIRGDPGYLCTSVMLAESALALLDTSKLTPIGKQGGVLTAVSALGDELVTRLDNSGRFQFESSIITPEP